LLLGEAREDAAQRLVEAALARDASDNVTAVVLDVLDAS
jgi:serine/threonine protein phosphatase PrpC